MKYKQDQPCSAFDCTELLKRLPVWSIVELTPEHYAARNEFVDQPWSFFANTPAEALGKLYLWCLENGHIKEVKI